VRVIRSFDPWRSPLCTCPPKFTVNPYTGCSHRCLYCYASSYIKDFFKPRVKHRLLENALRDIDELEEGAVVEMAASSDPFQHLELRYNYTGQLARMLLERGFKVLFTTKAPNVLLNYRDLLVKHRESIAVAVTVTTLDERISARLEPGAPPPGVRLKAIGELSKLGIKVTLRLDPVIPMVNDDPKAIEALVREAARLGVVQVTSSTYKVKPDNFARMTRGFPELAQALREMYYAEGERVGGYRYLRRSVRLEILKRVREAAEGEGLGFATCREGLEELNTPDTVCDGSGPLRGSGSS